MGSNPTHQENRKTPVGAQWLVGWRRTSPILAINDDGTIRTYLDRTPQALAELLPDIEKAPFGHDEFLGAKTKRM